MHATFLFICTDFHQLIFIYQVNPPLSKAEIEETYINSLRCHFILIYSHLSIKPHLRAEQQKSSQQISCSSECAPVFSTF